MKLHQISINIEEFQKQVDWMRLPNLACHDRGWPPSGRLWSPPSFGCFSVESSFWWHEPFHCSASLSKPYSVSFAYTPCRLITQTHRLLASETDLLFHQSNLNPMPRSHNLLINQCCSPDLGLAHLCQIPQPFPIFPNLQMRRHFPWAFLGR